MLQQTRFARGIPDERRGVGLILRTPLSVVRGRERDWKWGGGGGGGGGGGVCHVDCLARRLVWSSWLKRKVVRSWT